MGQGGVAARGEQVYGEDESNRVFSAGPAGGFPRHVAEPQGDHGYDGNGLCDGVYRGGLFLRRGSDVFLRGAADLRARALGLGR